MNESSSSKKKPSLSIEQLNLETWESEWPEMRLENRQGPNDTRP
jgi:hypothetical protein